MEENTIRIITKSYFLYDGKHVTLEEFKKCDDPMRKALRLVKKIKKNSFFKKNKL